MYSQREGSRILCVAAQKIKARIIDSLAKRSDRIQTSPISRNECAGLSDVYAAFYRFRLKIERKLVRTETCQVIMV